MEAHYSSPQKRPGCVTAYAILMFTGAGLIAIGGMVAVSEGEGLITIIAFVLAVLYFLLAIGIWRLKNWARIILIIVQSVGLLVNLFLLFFALGTRGSPVQSICGQGAGLLVGGYIINWFWSHGEYFD